jgi:acylphosphatase
VTEQPEHARLHAFIDGSVQGVGFRMFVADHAQALGLTGWVRNTYDGRVEVLVEGTGPVLAQLLDKLRIGPRSAFVTEVQSDWEPASGEFKSFVVRPTSY